MPNPQNGEPPTIEPAATSSAAASLSGSERPIVAKQVAANARRVALKNLRASGISDTPASPSVSNQSALQARTQRGQESSPPHQVFHVHHVSLSIRVHITPRFLYTCAQESGWVRMCV